MHALQEAIEHYGEYTCRSYSGRAMYGRECLGVIVDNGSGLGKLLAYIIENTDEDNRGDIAHSVRNLRTDSMGLDTIVYFPGTPYTDPDEDDCEDEESEVG